MKSATMPVRLSDIEIDNLAVLAQTRHLFDDRTPDDAWRLAQIDADDMRGARESVPS